MTDPRYDDLANVLINHSTKLKKGEKILIEAIDVPDEVVGTIIRKVDEIGALAFITVKHNRILRELYSTASEQSMKLAGEFEAARMEKMDAYIALRGSYNVAELSDVPQDKMKLYTANWWKPVHIDIRVPKTKWVVLRWPHPSMAQQANMSTNAFENFYFDVCTMDYDKMSKAMDPLVDRLLNTDNVHIKGEKTDLRFSIKDILVKKDDGERNIPGGEVFTAPVKDSVEGHITYNTKTIYQGTPYENIHFEFEKGKIVKATADKTEKLNEVLDTDEGARYIGEFALGLNPYITQPMLDILFDEKIGGSFHFTPGSAYEETDNGNRSEVHWDIVMMQTPEYGGGEIYFDGELIRKDGLFVPTDLQALNPENLK